jgi:hypothetical protein
MIIVQKIKGKLERLKSKNHNGSKIKRGLASFRETSQTVMAIMKSPNKISTIK